MREFLELAVDREGRTITMERRSAAFHRLLLAMIHLHMLIGMAYTLQKQLTE